MVVNRPMLIFSVRLMILMGLSTLFVTFYICCFKKNGSSPWTAPVGLSMSDPDLWPRVQNVPVICWVWGTGVSELDPIPALIKRIFERNNGTNSWKWQNENHNYTLNLLECQLQCNPGVSTLSRKSMSRSSLNWVTLQPHNWFPCSLPGSFHSQQGDFIKSQTGWCHFCG